MLGSWVQGMWELSARSFFFLAVPRGLQDPSSLTGDRTRVPAVKASSPNHWTAREYLA